LKSIGFLSRDGFYDYESKRSGIQIILDRKAGQAGDRLCLTALPLSRHGHE
jgi:hypothetical protein